MEDAKYNEFENEVLTRLSAIDIKLSSLESSKETTYKNERDILLLTEHVSRIEGTLKSVKSAIVSIIIAVAIAVITYILKL